MRLTTFLEGFVDDNGDNIIPFKLDIYGLCYRNTSEVAVGDYYSGAKDADDATLIQKAYFIVQTPNVTPNGFVKTSENANEKIVDYLNAQYDACAT